MPNLHPLLVHFPIALIFVVVVCDLLGLLLKKRSLTDTASVVTVFLLIGAAAAVISGLLAEGSIWHSEQAHELMGTHETVGLIFLGTIIVMAALRFGFRGRVYGGLGWLVLVVGIIGAGVVGYGSYLGGEMVYRHGAGVTAAEQATVKVDSLMAQLRELKGAEEEEDEAETQEESGHEHEHEH